MAGCGGSDPTVSTEAVPTTTVDVGPMGTLPLVTGDGRTITFGQLIAERDLVPIDTSAGTIWFEATTGGAFMAGDCHGVTPEQVDPAGDRVQVVACYGADGHDEINQRVG